MFLEKCVFMSCCGFIYEKVERCATDFTSLFFDGVERMRRGTNWTTCILLGRGETIRGIGRGSKRTIVM